MKDVDDRALKSEIEEISKKIDAILQQVEQANPLRPNEETSPEK
jgi:hypothetical protein